MILPPLSGAKAAARLRQILSRGAAPSPEIEAKVRAILADVRERGVAAATEYARSFDGLGPRQPLRLSGKTVETAAAKCPKPVQDAIKRAIRQVRAFRRAQRDAQRHDRGLWGQCRR